MSMNMDDMRRQRNKGNAANAVNAPDGKRSRPKRRTVQISLKVTPEELAFLETLTESLGTTRTEAIMTGARILYAMNEEDRLRAKVRWQSNRDAV